MKRDEQMMNLAELAELNSRTIDLSKKKVFMSAYIQGWKDADSHSQWIPVEEELPKEKQKVIVYMPADERCDHEYMCEALYNYAWHKWEDADEPIELEGVTHWMPIPQPPQGKEQDYGR